MITFVVVDNINRSCRKQSNNLKGTLLCQDLQKLWVVWREGGRVYAAEYGHRFRLSL